MKIIFTPVTPQNRPLALSLHVAPTQLGTVETTQECLAEADQLALWRPVIIEADDSAVGFAMYGLWQEEGSNGRVWLDRFFIDEHHQGKGLAKPVLEQLLNHISKEYGRNEIYLSVYQDNLVAIGLYRHFDFAFNGEIDAKGELVMVKHLSATAHTNRR